MLQPGRSYSAGSQYRYGFNGKEKDKDIGADDYDFGARVYDGRIGKFLSLDPKQKKYPNESHYAFVSNSPLIFADLDGRDKIITITIIGKDGKASTTTTVIKDRYINYTHIDKPGFGNDIWVRYDVIETLVMDYSKPKYTTTYSVREGDRHEISGATYRWHKIKAYFNTENNRSVQGGGFTMTSEFSNNGDGAKADAKYGSSGLWYVDGFNAAFNALSKSPDYAADLKELMTDIMSKANEITEKILEDREKKELETAKKKMV